MHFRGILRQAGLAGLCLGAVVISRSALVSKSSVEASRRTVSSGGPIIPQQPMGAPLLGLTEEQLARFFVGREQFDRTFTVEEGLGPVFNQNSCGSCHGNPLGGPGSITVTRAGRLEKGGFDPLTELGGSLFQQEAIDDACAEVVPEEANVIAFRVTNGMMGYGLVEAIPDSAILANADPVDVNGDGISGKAVIVSAVEDNLDHVGRFGWKADAASMITFSAGASLNEMGMTNYYKPTDQDPNGINPPELGDCDTVADYEIGIAFILQLADFQRFLTAAPQTPKSGMTGEALFVSIGCSDCHIPAFTTPDDPGLEDALRNKEIRQYTDYLVHDAGLAADFIAEGEAGQREIKTAPLAGIRTRDPMWHDGRVAAGTFADRMRAAIACHCAIFSEAGASAERFLSGTVAECPDSLTVPGSGFQCEPGEVEGGLNDEQRDAVIAFLDSLGRREFDADGENGVLVDDFTNMVFCSEIGVPITPDHECAIHDIDQNGIIDGSDFESFLLAFDGELIDCNCNGTNDLADIFFGQSPDGDGDGVPDECLPGDPPVCINLEFRPPSQSVLIGDTVSIGLYAVSDDETDASLTAAQVIISWDPSLLRLLGNDGTGAVPLLSSGFPPNDPFNLNEVVPPQDGDGLYVALAPLGNTVPTTPEGVLLTTFQFLALADTPQTPVDILDSGGDPLGETIVFDGIVPNLDVSGTLIGSVVEIILEPPPDPTLLLTADPSAAQIGDPVVVTLSMLNLGSNEAAGFQAFLSFDITRLTFISGSYTPEPFGLPIILPIEADGGNIDLAAVINVFGGQSPTSVDAELVQLTFEALVGGCVVSVTFREYITPTALTDPVGLPIEPLLLIGLPDLADVDDGDACTDDICDPDTGEVTHIPNYDNQSECCDPATGNTTLIDDSDACTDDTCDPLTGQVTHTPIDPSTCNDGIACTFDFCDSQLGCVSAPVNSVCDDGLACTTDICDAELGCVNSSECPTDVDGDFNTGAFDLAVLLGCWGVLTPGVCDCLDADDNGDIGAFDLAVLLGGWGPCDLSAPPNDDCVDHISIFNGDTLFDSISATTDGPAHPDDCQFDGQTPIDIWYDYNATCTGDLTLSTCDQSIYNSDLVVYDGCDCGNLVLLGCNDDAAECALFFTSELTVPVVADNCYLVRIGGFGAAGTITISCAGG